MFEYLHFADNTSAPDLCRKIDKTIFDYLVIKFKTYYVPERGVSIDISSTAKGRISGGGNKKTKLANFSGK